MARFLIVTMPITGHVLPALPIARTLVARGHQVLWYSGQKFHHKIEASGAQFCPMLAARDYDDADLNAAFPERGTLKALDQIKYDFKHIFIDAIPGQVADLREILREFPADVMLGDPSILAIKILHEQGGPPWAIFNISVLGVASRDTAPFGLGILPDSGPFGRLRNRALAWLATSVVFRDVNQHLAGVLASINYPVEPFGMPLSPYLFLSPTIPAFEYPRSDLPPQVHFIGGLLPDFPREFSPPAWWPDVTNATRPVVLVTQGTIATAADQLIAPTLQALADEDLLVVATTGGRPVEEFGLGRLPANARVVPFIPFDRLMPYVSTMVTNGGYGGVTIALRHGVPLVVGGTTEDKAEVSNRVQWAGVGINLKTATPTPRQVRAAVRQVISQGSYRQRAQALAAEFARHDAASEAAQLLEQLSVTRQPVVRNRDMDGGTDSRMVWMKG